MEGRGGHPKNMVSQDLFHQMDLNVLTNSENVKVIAGIPFIQSIRILLYIHSYAKESPFFVIGRQPQSIYQTTKKIL